MPGSDPNEEGLRALGRAVDGSWSSRRSAKRQPAHARRDKEPKDGDPPRHRRRWLRRTLVITAAIVVLVVAAGAGYYEYVNHEVHRITVKGLTPDASTGGDAGTENILMVGSTTRCGLAKQTANYGLCTQGVTGVNSDVVMILHLDPATGSVSVLSIPRDLFVPNARSTGAYKIDAALAQGPSQLVAAIEEDFAIPIQHYVELNFDSFAAVVTALGGITMTFPIPIADAYSGLRVIVSGCHHLNGVQALQVVRARHLQHYVAGESTPSTWHTWPQEAESDLARIRRDHEFLRVLASQVAKRGIGTPGTDLSVINAIAPHLTVDNGLSTSHMLNLVLTFHSVNVNKAPQLTLPVKVGNFGTYLYAGGNFGDVEFPTQPLDQSVVDQFLGLGTDTNTMTGEPLPKPATVTVSVLNGTGGGGQASQTASALTDLGFKVVGTGTTTPVAQYEETYVTYSQRTPAAEAAAQLVADSLSGEVILQYGQTTGGSEVTVTTGTNFSVEASPPAPEKKSKSTTTTTRAAATPSTSTVSTSPATTPAFSTASPAVQPLAPWDPRACPPGVKGTDGPW